MEGATVVLGALMPSVLVKDQRFANALENLANEYLVPLFASPHAFLRSKAVWLAGQYASDLEYSMPGQKEKQRGQGPLFDKLFELTLACMNDRCGCACLCKQCEQCLCPSDGFSRLTLRRSHNDVRTRPEGSQALYYHSSCCGPCDGWQLKGLDQAFNQPCAFCSDLPTQVEAVNSFREFVEALDAADRIEERLKPILKDLLSHFFRMASSVEAMDVIITVDTIVERIGEGIQPFAVDCCREVRSTLPCSPLTRSSQQTAHASLQCSGRVPTRLRGAKLETLLCACSCLQIAASKWQYVQLVAVYHKAVAETAGDEDEDALFSALFHIMQPIIKLVDACSELPETLALLEDLLLPMLADMCAHKQEEACEQVQSISCMVWMQSYHSQAIRSSALCVHTCSGHLYACLRTTRR
jgi:hypothetical protein